MKYSDVDLKNIEELKIILQDLVDNDQEVLKKYDYESTEVEKVMTENRSVVKKIVKFHDLITKSKFGEQASFNTWLLIQHFPESEVVFMENYLELMKANMDDINLRNYAYLDDRINMYKKFPQKYGTQVYEEPKHSKNHYFYAIDKVDQVDRLRKSMNLEPLVEYVELWAETGHKLNLPKGYAKEK